MNTVRFLVFADLHYYPGVFYSDGINRLRQIFRRAEESHADAIIELGDLVHGVRLFPEMLEECRKAPLPLYHVLGNHDTDDAYLAEVVEAYRIPSNYYYFDLKGFRFIALDTNYYRHPGGTTHFQFRNYFDFPDTRESLPEEELAWLKETIDSAPGLCVLLSHASLERIPGGVRQHKELMEIIRQANTPRRKVLISLNGHHHRDALSILENTAFFDVNSATFDWLHDPHSLFPEELTKQYELINHQVIFQEPLSAVVTLSDDGTIDIQGCHSSFFRGISREMTGNAPCDRAGRPCTASILSAHLKIN